MKFLELLERLGAYCNVMRFFESRIIKRVRKLAHYYFYDKLYSSYAYVRIGYPLQHMMCYKSTIMMVTEKHLI